MIKSIETSEHRSIVRSLSNNLRKTHRSYYSKKVILLVSLFHLASQRSSSLEANNKDSPIFLEILKDSTNSLEKDVFFLIKELHQKEEIDQELLHYEIRKDGSKISFFITAHKYVNLFTEMISECLSVLATYRTSEADFILMNLLR